MCKCFTHTGANAAGIPVDAGVDPVVLVWGYGWDEGRGTPSSVGGTRNGPEKLIFRLKWRFGAENFET